jgi:GxxExxY protein
MNENEISYKIIGVVFEAHRNIGPGLLESVYENVLYFDLKQAGLNVACQVPMPFIYKAARMEVGYRIDMVAEGKVLMEVKSVETLAPVHYAQTRTYLKLSGLKLGLLINFNVKTLKDSIYRIVNNLSVCDLCGFLVSGLCVKTF